MKGSAVLLTATDGMIRWVNNAFTPRIAVDDGIVTLSGVVGKALADKFEARYGKKSKNGLEYR